MKASRQAKRTALVAAVLCALGTAGASWAAQLSTDIVYQSLGSPVRSAATGACVRTGFWTPDSATGPCGEEQVASKSAAPVAETEPAPDTAAQPQSELDSASASIEDEPVPLPPPRAAAQSKPAPKSSSDSVPEFVSEPEPADMVPLPPMTTATDEDQRISEPKQFYDEENPSASGDAIGEPKQNPKSANDVAVADMARGEPPPAAPVVSVNAVQQAPPPAAPPITANAERSAAPAQQRGHLTLNGETHFDFDRYVLRPDDMKKIDALLADLSESEYDSILVTGHTDRIGSDAYNKQLSEQRALAVKRYLSSKGVNSANIETNAVGAAEPATPPGACEGMRFNKTIACLAPDRRVEIDVVGMRQK